MNAQSKPDRGAKPKRLEGGSGSPLVALDSAIFKDVHVDLVAKLGAVSLSIEDLLAMKAGAVLKLDRQMTEPVDLYLNDALVARGEIVAVDDSFAVRIVEVAAP